MEIFRIALSKYSQALFASGNENRWNYKGEKVIYAASSRSLACLENVVHTSGEALQNHYKIMIIYVPDNVFIESVNSMKLDANWHKTTRPPICQKIGSKWYNEQSSLLLKIPSAIVLNEYNFIINTNHPNFKEVKIIAREDFSFDPRIKIDPKRSI